MVELKKGDIVCYTSKFLKSVQWHTNVPIDGRVEDASDPEYPIVLWCDRDDPIRVFHKNLILKSELHKEPA